MRRRPLPCPFAAALAAAALAVGATASRAAAEHPPPSRSERGRPWIGLQLAPAPTGTGTGTGPRDGGAPAARGVSITGTMPGSPGERAGLGAGDRVLALDGRPVNEPRELQAMVRAQPIGATVKLTLAGPQEPRFVAVTLVARPDEAAMQRGALVDRPAPEFTPSLAPRPDGSRPEPITLHSLQGQVVLLDFFATWCGPCVAALPHIERLHEQLGPQGLRVLGLSAETPEVVAGAAKRYGLRYPLAVDKDEQIAARYQVFALPTLVVIDRQGVVRTVAVADTEAADRSLRALLRAPATGK